MEGDKISVRGREDSIERLRWSAKDLAVDSLAGAVNASYTDFACECEESERM